MDWTQAAEVRWFRHPVRMRPGRLPRQVQLGGGHGAGPGPGREIISLHWLVTILETIKLTTTTVSLQLTLDLAT